MDPPKLRAQRTRAAKTKVSQHDSTLPCSSSNKSYTTQVSTLNRTLPSRNSANAIDSSDQSTECTQNSSQGKQKGRKMYPVDFEKDEWTRQALNGGKINSQLFNQIYQNGVATDLVMCKKCDYHTDKRNHRSMILHRQKHYGNVDLEKMQKLVRDRAVKVIMNDGRPLSTFSTESMQAYSLACFKLGDAYSKSGLELEPEVIAPSRWSLNRDICNLHEQMQNLPEWKEFITTLRHRGAFTADLAQKRRKEYFVLTGTNPS